jgi:hypothetical protein
VFAILAAALMVPFELIVLAVTGYGPLHHGHVNEGVSVLLQLIRWALITPLISALHMRGGRDDRQGAAAALGSRARASARSRLKRRAPALR